LLIDLSIFNFFSRGKGIVNGFHTTGRSGLSRGIGIVGSNGSLTLHHARSNSLVNNRPPEENNIQTGGDRVVLLPFEEARGSLSNTASLGRVSKQLTTTTITSSSTTAVHRTTTTVQKRGQGAVSAPSPNVDSPGERGGAATTTEHHPHHHHLLQMGPDGQPMDYSGVPRPNQVTVPGPDYVPAGAAAYGTNPRTHFPPQNNQPTEHAPYDPSLVQDQYVYAARGVQPDPAGMVVDHFTFILSPNL